MGAETNILSGGTNSPEQTQNDRLATILHSDQPAEISPDTRKAANLVVPEEKYHICIVPLSEKTLEEICSLVTSTFSPISPEPQPAEFFRAYISNDRSFMDPLNIIDLRYWIAIEKKSNLVVGTVGLYHVQPDYKFKKAAGLESDKDDVWLGEFCVHENYRNNGIGSKLLNQAIQTAKQERHKYLSLWTTIENKEERLAQSIYILKSFQLIKRFQNFENIGYDILVRRKEL